MALAMLAQNIVDGVIVIIKTYINPSRGLYYVGE